MTALVQNPHVAESLIEERRRKGVDRQDETWEGVYVGGPDFAVEIISPHDRSREKLDFYAAVGTRELLLIDRDPWRLELYRLDDGELKPQGESTPGNSLELAGEVLPLSWRLLPGEPRPQIETLRRDGERWVV